MAEQEKTVNELRADLMRDTEESLLRSIRESAGRFDQPGDLKELAEAYSLVMESKLTLSGGTGQAGRAVPRR